MSIRTTTALGAFALLASTALAGGPQSDVQMMSFSGIPNFDGTFTFDQFNAADFGSPSDIVFKGVEIKATATIDGGILQVDNDGIDAAAITNAELGASVVLSSSDILAALPSVNPVTQGTFNLGPNNGDGPTFDPQPLSEPDYDELVGTNVMDMDDASFNDVLGTALGFVGAGTFDVDYDALAIFDFGGVGGVSFGGTPVNLTIEVTVTYLYNVVPAPAGIAAFGIAGLAGLRRRR